MRIIGIALGILLLVCSVSSRAQEALCAEVKIEILQELTMERQGFEASMKITNSLDTFELQDVSVSVFFKDENDNPVIATSNTSASNAAFFIRVDDTRNVTNLQEGAAGFVQYGRIAPKTVGEIRWLIIPTANATGQTKDGKLYFVGAELKYSYGGKQEVVNVAADSIVVKPQPLLTLDYFLTQEVIGDDAFTPAIEAAEPYTLGVRISNNGYGVAQSVKIESAQPRIVENSLGLAISFKIIKSFIEDQLSSPSLLINFGNIDPQDVSVGRWVMETSLSGKFTSFTASFTHADELGGELTSLLQATNAHFLVHDVIVDVNGRDNLRDFLAYDAQADLKVYESEKTGANELTCTNCQPVTQRSANISNISSNTSSMTFSAAAGLVFANANDPFNGSKLLAKVVRSDGSVVNPQNAWLSKHRKTDGIHFDYKVNIFDANSNGSYTLYWGQNIVEIPQAPVIQLVPSWANYEGGQLGFMVQATDPNNTTPVLSAVQLPAGATFVNSAPNAGVFQWSPGVGQAGSYLIKFAATDGQLISERSASIVINSAEDTDGDGMDDDWEREKFGDLSRDGTGDSDNDGRTDLEEFLENSDPNLADGLPAAPQILSPIFDGDTLANAQIPLLPLISVTNGVHPNNLGAVDIVFELYSDEALTDLIATASVNEGSGTSSWQVTNLDLPEGFSFADNHLYFWRAKSVKEANPLIASAWIKSQFFINTQNDAPTAPQISSPGLNAQVADLTPSLVALASTDLDRDAISYEFRLFSDANLTTPLATQTLNAADANGQLIWTLENPLQEDQGYQWQVIAKDSENVTTASVWSNFFVSTINHAPTTPTIQSPVDAANNLLLENGGIRLVINGSSDPEGTAVVYEFEIDRQNTFDSPAKLTSGAQASTEWIANPLEEDTEYFWRARAFDGVVYSNWTTAQFGVSSINQPPSIPTLLNPVDGGVVSTLTPVLQVNPSSDPENKPLNYRYQIYADVNLSGLVIEKVTSETQWTLEQNLMDQTTYYWRVRAEDEKNLAGDWSEVADFSVLLPVVNQPPEMTFVLPDTPVLDTNKQVLVQWVDADVDSNATIALYYKLVGSNSSPINIVNNLSEDLDGTDDQYLWNTSGIPAGDYQLSAVIADEDSSETVNACCIVTIEAESSSSSSASDSSESSGSSESSFSSESSSSGSSEISSSSSLSDSSDSSSSSSASSSTGTASSGSVNMVPTAITMNEDTTQAITGLGIANVDVGASNFTVTLAITDGVLNVNGGSAVIANNGTNSVYVTGTQTEVNSTLASVNYVPTANFYGNSTLTMTTVDAGAGALIDVDAVSITVDNLWDFSGPNYSTTGDENTVINDFVGYWDSTTSGGVLSYQLLTNPQNGTLVFNTDGTYSYTPNSNYTGNDSFQYQVNDVTASESATRTVTVTVNAVNYASSSSSSSSSSVNSSASSSSSQSSSYGANFVITKIANNEDDVRDDGELWVNAFDGSGYYNGPNEMSHQGNYFGVWWGIQQRPGLRFHITSEQKISQQISSAKLILYSNGTSHGNPLVRIVAEKTNNCASWSTSHMPSHLISGNRTLAYKDYQILDSLYSDFREDQANPVPFTQLMEIDVTEIIQELASLPDWIGLNSSICITADPLDTDGVHEAGIRDFYHSPTEAAELHIQFQN
jgi:hypothetical protein